LIQNSSFHNFLGTKSYLQKTLEKKIRKPIMKHSILNRIILVSLFTFIFGSCSEDSTTEPELTLDQKLQKALDDGIWQYGGKGISAAVIFPDGHTWQGAAGISHGSVTVTPTTLFSAGSITKTFTAVTIMKMVEDGTLTLDDSLHKWFPTYQNIDSTITIRQLLNHTSGIFNVTENQQVWQDVLSNPLRIWTAEEILTNYVLEPEFVKGSQWGYSNTGYILLRKLIRDINASTVGEVYRTRIFDPYGLSATYLYPDEILPGAVAHGWWDITGDQIYDDISINPSFYSAAGGGIFATAMDLAKWAKALFINGNVVSQNSFEQMTDFYTPILSEPLAAGYGLGIMQFNPDLFGGLTVYGHGGDAPGYAAASVYLADYDVCLGIGDNTEDGDTMGVFDDLMPIIIDHLEN
jgi:D-alanyl-D-alanine carboxypeptidase